jgi:hypothetical protein
LPNSLNGRKVISVNLRGEETGKAFEIAGGKISIEISRYKPYSFIIL